MSRRLRFVRRQRGGADGLYRFAVLLGVASMVAPGVSRLVGMPAIQDATLRQFVFGGVLIALALLTAALGVTVRGDPLGIFSAGRNRYSLSRLQMALWTWLILGALIAVAICRAWGMGGAPAGAALVIQIDSNLLAIMGISYFTGAAAPGLLSLKADDRGRAPALVADRRDGSPVNVLGQIIYRPANFVPRVVDLIDGDEASNSGAIDLSKLQQLLITFTLVAVYGVMLFNMFGSDAFVVASGVSKGATVLPPLSKEIVELLLVSHAGYLGYNAVSKPPAAPDSSGGDAGPPPTPHRDDEP